MSALVIQSGTVVTPHGVERGWDVAIADGRIRHVGRYAPGSGDEVIEADGLYVMAGFIDLQVNGYAGCDFMDGEPAAVGKVSQRLLAHGVTGFLPTLVTASPEQMLGSVRAVWEGSGAASGAVPLGLHVEGPFIAVAKRGSHPVQHVRPFDDAEFERWWRESRGTIRMLTLAPEVGANLGHIPAVRQRAIAVAVGHSDATYADVERAVAAGATCATHAFNGMRGLHHREPGVAGALLAMPQLAAGVIADGHHVHPGALRALYRAKGPRELYLVTDVVPVAGLPDGKYEWIGGTVISDGETVRLERDGGLAGAALTMNRAVANMMRFVGASLPEVSVMASLTPARVLGLHDRGQILPGLRADVTLLDERFRVARTLVAGETRYTRYIDIDIEGRDPSESVGGKGEPEPHLS